MLRAFCLSLCLAAPAWADTVVAARTIRAQTVLSAGDLAVRGGEVPGGISDPAELIGQEARVSLYAGRPVRRSDVGPPAVIERNQIVPMIFEANGLTISAEGRSLSRAGPGDSVRIMNTSSRNTVSGRVLPDGRVRVRK